MEANDTSHRVPLEVSFRPVKRRKVFRQRRESVDSSHDQELPGSVSPGLADVATDAPETQLSVIQAADDIPLSEVLRMRKAAQRRKGGVEFSSSTPQPQGASLAPPPAPVLEAADSSIATSLVNARFVPPTAKVVDVDKHMTAYIESEIAKERDIYPTSSSSSTSTAANTLLDANGQALSQSGALQNARTIQRQPASIGRLHEIDLGAETRRRNIERTQAAVEGRPTESEVKEEPVKMRLCRDGKFRPRRRKKRRNSDDLKRDQIVEDMFRESRLDIYDSPEEAAAAATAVLDNGVADGTSNGDQAAADDEVAEKFRREFLEAVATRHAQHRKQKKKKKEGEKSDDKIGGPKLGGSRSQRAAMHAKQVADKQAEREAGKR